MSERVRIEYGDITVGAKESFVASATDKANFVDLSQFQTYNLNVKNYANPCEMYQTLLDGSMSLFPDYPENENMGLWSESISEADGSFANAHVLTLQSTGRYMSVGLTLTFDTYNNIFANDINVKWYQGDTLLDDKDFEPDTPLYFCNNPVEAYDKIVITFNSLNMPNNRLKLRSVDYGNGTVFYKDELRKVNLIQQIDPLSESLIINTCDFTLDSKSDFQYSFQKRQPISIYFDGDLKATVFVESAKRTGKRLWEVKGEDFVSFLDDIKFVGGIYEGKNAVELLEHILTKAKIPYDLSAELNSETVTGYIPICSCREAIQHICFAIGAVVDTSNSYKLKIYKLSDDVTQKIPKTRIVQGQSFSENDKYTEIQVVEHKYVETLERVDLYNAVESGTGENIYLEFSKPVIVDELELSNGNTFAVDSEGNELKGENYAVINARTNDCTLIGFAYKDLQKVRSLVNPNMLATDTVKQYVIDKETLVSSANVDRILNTCYNYYSKRKTYDMNIIEGKHTVRFGEFKFGERKFGEVISDEPVNVGDVVTTETEYMGDVTVRIVSTRFNLDGGIIVKECELI